MKVLILGATGQIAMRLRINLLKETSAKLVLFARNGEQRLSLIDPRRETIISGNFQEEIIVKKSMKGIDIVYLNDMGNSLATKVVIEIMKRLTIKRFIGVSILGIDDEIAGTFGEWNKHMIGFSSRNDEQKESARIVEESDLDYTLLRLPWLYNDVHNESYQMTYKGEAFVGAQITRDAVARFITKLIISNDRNMLRQSIGLSEPGSEELDKPMFYN